MRQHGVWFYQIVSEWMEQQRKDKVGAPPMFHASVISSRETPGTLYHVYIVDQEGLERLKHYDAAVTVPDNPGLEHQHSWFRVELLMALNKALDDMIAARKAPEAKQAEVKFGMKVIKGGKA